MSVDRILRALAAAVLTAVLLMAPASAGAQEDGDVLLSRFSLGVMPGFTVPNTDEFGSSFYLRGAGAYSFSENLALEFGFSWFTSEIDHGLDSPPGSTVADGDMSIFPFTLNLQFRYPLEEIFGAVYVLGGVGLYMIDYDWSGSSGDYFALVEEIYGPAVQEISNSFGFQAGVGYEYPLTAQAYLNFETQYVFLQPKAEGDWRDLLTGERHTFSKDLDLNTWIFTLGVKYRF